MRIMGLTGKLCKLSERQSMAICVEISDVSSLLLVRAYVRGKNVAEMKCVKEEDGSILIGDILHQSKAYNHGYGSSMMNKLISYATENGCVHIWGNLSEIDREHQARLHHFYQKHGFEVTIFEQLNGTYYGRIDKFL